MLENLIFSFDEICFSISSELTTPNLHYNGHFFLPQKLFSQNRLILGELLKSPWKWTTQKNCCLRENGPNAAQPPNWCNNQFSCMMRKKSKACQTFTTKLSYKHAFSSFNNPIFTTTPIQEAANTPNKNVFINSKTCRDVFKDTSTRSLQGFRSQCWTSTAFDTSQCTYILHTVRNLHFLFKKSIFGNFNFWKLNFGTKIRVFW